MARRNKILEKFKACIDDFDSRNLETLPKYVYWTSLPVFTAISRQW